MKERVFVQLPRYWTAHMSDDLKLYCGVPLLLMKALYGYTFSGKFLYLPPGRCMRQKAGIGVDCLPKEIRNSSCSS